MGDYACRALAAADEVDQVVVADRDQPRAETVAGEIGGKARALGLDISDGDALRTALGDVDVVLNTAGPFYRLGRPVLEAAIDTGTHYLDICDDWEPTLEMTELDESAKQAGVTAVIGMGASPGTSNMLAVMAINQLDEPERVFTAWRAGAGVPRPTDDDPEPDATAAVEHWVHNCSDPIKIWRGGELIDAWGLEEMKLRYPGRGEESVWLCGHPEPLTIPRTYPQLQESLNVMTSRRGLIDAISRIAERVKSGELDVPTGAKKLLVEPNMWGSAAGPAPNFPDIFAVVEGTKDGKRVRVGAEPVALPSGNMGEYTGIPLAVATLMLVRGQIDKRGVHGPEGAVDAEIYFKDLAAFVTDVPDNGELVALSTEDIDE